MSFNEVTMTTDININDRAIADCCEALVQLLLMADENDERNNQLAMTNFWPKLERLHAFAREKSIDLWMLEIHEIRKTFIKFDLQGLNSIIALFNDTWKWPFIMTLNIEICKKHIRNIHHEVSDVTHTWKKFVKTLNFMIDLIANLNNSQYQIPITSTMQLCLIQIRNNISLFVLAIENKSDVIRKYTTHCLTLCLDQLEKEILSKSEIACNEFIDLMDSAIGQLDNLVYYTFEWKNSDSMESIKNLVDELLCHAMTTAHVTTNKNSKEEILSKSQVILRDMESLKDALVEQETASITLTAQSLCNDLCRLERLVNSAVLKLVLHTGTIGDKPVRNLVKMCQPNPDEMTTNSSVNRKAGDLDNLIISFDSHLDRIMQIGAFAISCSSSAKKAVELKSCLASFESMEAELVPCVTAMYLNSTSNNKRDLRLLVNHWLLESTNFRNVLDTIIDPAAYTEEVKSFLVESINEIEAQNYLTSSECLKKMIEAVRTLKGVVQVSIQLETFGSGPEFAQRHTQVTEATAKCEDLCSSLETKSINFQKNKIMKYSRNLLDAVENLLNYQTSKMIESQLSNDLNEPPINYYKLCVSDVGSPEQVHQLAQHIAEGERLAKKSVLYNTPKRSTRLIPKTPLPKSVLVRSDVRCSTITAKRHRFSVQREQSKKAELSDMELTMLLDDLKGTDDTFSPNQTLLPCKDFQGRNLLDLFTNWTTLIDSSDKSFITISAEPSNITPDSNHVDTLERMRDLKTVEEKIDNLRS